MKIIDFDDLKSEEKDRYIELQRIPNYKKTDAEYEEFVNYRKMLGETIPERNSRPLSMYDRWAMDGKYILRNDKPSARRGRRG